MVGHHEGLWMPEVQNYFVFFYMCLFCWLACYVFLCFVIHGSNTIDMSSLMQWVICCGYYGYLMEMCIMLCEGDLCGVSTPLMEGGPRTWISSGSHGGDVFFFWEVSFVVVVVPVYFVVECIKYKKE
jgi:hypothetical protein